MATAPQFIPDAKMVEPLEGALNSQDQAVRTAIKQAFEVRRKRLWHELFVVSCTFSDVPEDTRKEHPLARVVVSGMACQRVRESDPYALEQIEHVWMSTGEEPSLRHFSLTLSDLKIWYQPTPDNFAQCRLSGL